MDWSLLPVSFRHGPELLGGFDFFGIPVPSSASFVWPAARSPPAARSRYTPPPHLPSSPRPGCPLGTERGSFKPMKRPTVRLGLSVHVLVDIIHASNCHPEREGQAEGRRSALHTRVLLIRLTAMMMLALLFLGPSDGRHRLTLRLLLEAFICCVSQEPDVP